MLDAMARTLDRMVVSRGNFWNDGGSQLQAVPSTLGCTYSTMAIVQRLPFSCPWGGIYPKVTQCTSLLFAGLWLAVRLSYFASLPRPTLALRPPLLNNCRLRLIALRLALF